MKRRFNKNIVTTRMKLNEVNLFRQLATEFNTRFSRSTFVEETHSHKGFVEYDSRILGRRKVVEISDLLFITFNKALGEIRINFLQAKYQNKPYKKFISFKGNVFQRELLSEKPDVIDIHGLGFHRNILNFTNYKSITSYGVFYVDIKGEIDFLYTMPEYTLPRSFKTKNGITTFYFSPGPYCPNASCTGGMWSDETISTCSLDVFASEVLNGRIGAPLTTTHMPYFRDLFASMLEIHPKNSVIQEMNDYFRYGNFDDYGNDSDSSSNGYHPNTIIVITEGKVNPDEI